MQHVEQLLRTLNLNSPAPFAPKPTLNLDTSPSSPDFSPASVTSSLLQTPTDLSPSRSTFDSKLHSPYEFTHPLPTQSSLLFDHSHSPPRHIQESFISHSPSYRSSYSSQPTHTFNPPLSSSAAFNSAVFEPFSETSAVYHHSSATTGLSRPLYSSPPQAQISRRLDHNRQLPSVGMSMDWRLAHHHQQLPPPPPSAQFDWLLPDDLGHLKPEYNTGAVGNEEPLRPSYVFQHQAPQSTPHEVCYGLIFCSVSPSRIYPPRLFSLVACSFVSLAMCAYNLVYRYRCYFSFFGFTNVHVYASSALSTMLCFFLFVLPVHETSFMRAYNELSVPFSFSFFRFTEGHTFMT